MGNRLSTQPYSSASVLFAFNRALPIMACLYLLAGCQTCPPCVRPILPTEPQPILGEVETLDPSEPGAEYCLSDSGRIGILTNLELYRGALDKCNATIGRYNATIAPAQGKGTQAQGE